MSDFSSSDDDGADIEFSSLKKKFCKATDYVQQHHSKMEQSSLLELYGLYKQAMCGKCDALKPSFFNFQAKSKWEAWNNLGAMTKKQAMQNYVEKLGKTGLNFDEEHGSKKSQWVCLSLPQSQNEDIIPENNKTIFDYVKEENLEKIKALVTADNTNELDESGLGIIHWATDRNSIQILEYILEKCCANVNLRDIEQQTPLHYASSCGHIKCINILLKFGANPELKDESNQTPADVAFDDSVKSLILNFK